jgi:4-hydroxybenzoate polyprenyltransferase
MGLIASIAAVLGVLGVGIAVLSYLLLVIAASIWSFLIIGLLYFATIILYLLIINKPQEKQLRVAEILVSLFMLISYLSVIIEINF